MDIVVRRNDYGRDIVPALYPFSFFNLGDTLAREMWDTWTPFTLGEHQIPRTDVYEEKGDLVVKAELPGIDKKDIDVTLEGDRLTIKAEKKEEEKEDATHHTRERYYGSYLRSFTLPYPVKEGGVHAGFENGVLELRLPRAEEAKARKIEIKGQLGEGEPKKAEKKLKQKNT